MGGSAPPFFYGDGNMPQFLGPPIFQLNDASAVPYAGAKMHVYVSGTTTPITKITAEAGTESLEKAWLNCHTEEGQWLLETNPGVTGLNYQKLKSIFYPPSIFIMSKLFYENYHITKF